MLTGPLFAGARPETIESLRQTGLERVTAPGDSLFHEGDLAARLIVILTGRVRVWRSSPEGMAITVHLLGPGDVPGCVAVFRGIPYPATATAIDRVTTMSWPATGVPALLAQDPALAANAIGIVGSRNAEMLDRLLEVSTLGVEQRLARALVRLADGKSGAGAAIELRISRQELAELIATTLHTVSRFVSRWESEGIVAGGRGRITVRDRDRLSRLAGE